MDKLPEKSLGTLLQCHLFLPRKGPILVTIPSPELGTDIESELGSFRTEHCLGERGLSRETQRTLATGAGRHIKNEVHTQVTNTQGTGGEQLRV